MSAFMVSKTHIDYLVSAGKLWTIQKDPARWSSDPLSKAACDEIGIMLWRENERSIVARYGDDQDATINDYRHRITLDIDAAQVIKACNCYDYQACETDDYFESKAAKWVSALKAEAVKHIPGFSEAYERAEWCIPEPTHTVEVVSLADMARGQE